MCWNQGCLDVNHTHAFQSCFKIETFCDSVYLLIGRWVDPWVNQAVTFHFQNLYHKNQMLLFYLRPLRAACKKEQLSYHLKTFKRYFVLPSSQSGNFVQMVGANFGQCAFPISCLIFAVKNLVSDLGHDPSHVWTSMGWTQQHYCLTFVLLSKPFLSGVGCGWSKLKVISPSCFSLHFEMFLVQWVIEENPINPIQDCLCTIYSICLQMSLKGLQTTTF